MKIENDAAVRIYATEIKSGRWEASLGAADGPLLVLSARTPFLAAARVLLAQGYDGRQAMEMWRQGGSCADMRATIAGAAGLTVLENDRSGPRWAVYRPFDGRLPGHGDAQDGRLEVVS